MLHPYLDAQISKMELRIIASELGLSDIADLPAQPCLASRIETGIAVTEEDLVFAFQMEELARSHGLRGNVRCRITRKGVKLETSEIVGTSLMDAVKLNCTESGRKFAGHAPYQRGQCLCGTCKLMTPHTIFDWSRQARTGYSGSGLCRVKVRRAGLGCA